MTTDRPDCRMMMEMTMSGWDFDEVGKFGSTKAAEDFAKRNNVDSQEIRTRDTADGVELEIRRTNLDRRPKGQRRGPA